MIKSVIFILFVLSTNLVSDVYPHAKPVDMHYVVNGTDVPVKIIGLYPESVSELDTENYDNMFILRLTVIILSVMAVTVIVVYRQDIPLFTKFQNWMYLR